MFSSNANLFQAPANPEEVLEGTCATCKTQIEVLRKDSKSLPKSIQHWSDLPGGECPQCKALVYLTVKKINPVAEQNLVVIPWSCLQPKKPQVAVSPQSPVAEKLGDIPPPPEVLSKILEATLREENCSLTPEELDLLNSLELEADQEAGNIPFLEEDL